LIGKTLASFTSGSIPLNILVSDGIRDRLERFLLKSEGGSYRLKLLATPEETIAALDDPPAGLRWDLFLTSGFYTGLRSEVAVIMAAIKSFNDGKLRGVILYGTIPRDMEHCMKLLHEAKVPVAWLPYDHAQPSKHVREIPRGGLRAIMD
jgi:hypothetical protein